MAVLLNVLREARSHPWGDTLFLWVFLMTAIPPNLLLQLRLRDVDVHECTLSLGSKTRRPVVVPVPDFMAEYIQAFAAVHGVTGPDERVFVVPGADGALHPMTLEHVQRLVRELAALVTLPGVQVTLVGLWKHAATGLAADVAALGTSRPVAPRAPLAAAMVARWGGCHPWLQTGEA